ncbi:hypothetical protein HanRHA438_Chr13g0586901 [Helianthus annuus]|nr:hypothetical protein HanRHA438_Chr13g0586901 [Helianthus annuus]
MWFQFCCHFHPKSKFGKIFQLTSSFFFIFFVSFNKGQNSLFNVLLKQIKKI